MLLGNRSLGVHGDEVEDEGERLVRANDTRDEPVIALDRVLHRGDVLTRLVEAGSARRGHPLARCPGRYREVEDEVGPEQRLIELQYPIEIEAAGDVARQAGEEKSIGD